LLYAYKSIKQGLTPIFLDGILAAIALTHDLTLVTRYIKHVAATAAVILNP